MYRALCHDLSLDDAYDLSEIDQVSRSWRDAAQANAEIAAESTPKKKRRRAAR